MNKHYLSWSTMLCKAQKTLRSLKTCPGIVREVGCTVKLLCFLKQCMASLSQDSSDSTAISPPQCFTALTFPFVFLHSAEKHCLLLVSIPWFVFFYSETRSWKCWAQRMCPTIGTVLGGYKDSSVHRDTSSRNQGSLAFLLHLHPLLPSSMS